jgi:hypothetical protein
LDLTSPKNCRKYINRERGRREYRIGMALLKNLLKMGTSKAKINPKMTAISIYSEFSDF